MIKKFICGLCDYVGTRKSLRNHLKENHWKTKQITNITNMKGKTINQPWWKSEEFK